MNYGYSEGCKDWKSERKQKLAIALSVGLNIPIGWLPIKERIDLPYIEVDELYNGVRIRKITHLSDKQQEELIKKADKIFNEVMK